MQFSVISIISNFVESILYDKLYLVQSAYSRSMQKINTQSNLTNKFTENTPLKSQKKAQSMKVPFIATKVDRFIEINLARCRKISHAAFFRDSVPTLNLYSEIDKVTFSKQNIYFGQLFASVKCSKLIILLIEAVQ